MPSLLPVPTISRNSDSIISGSSASSAARPRPNDLFCIPRPTSWGSRHECLGEEWYNEHRDKTFHTLQYRKDNMAPWHEFILLFLTDGSVCRVERMGDVTPERRHDALFSKGIPAVDYMQVFPPPGVSAKGINPGPQPIEDGSILVAEIIYPIEVI
ncbi:hypothetical protein FRC11_002531 [Ceratobasidium sp. 423]|nr:hypothetical protein FRC11_002531 [Ceratobasidium sp. 423]